MSHYAPCFLGLHSNSFCACSPKTDLFSGAEKRYINIYIQYNIRTNVCIYCIGYMQLFMHVQSVCIFFRPFSVFFALLLRCSVCLILCKEINKIIYLCVCAHVHHSACVCMYVCIYIYIYIHMGLIVNRSACHYWAIHSLWLTYLRSDCMTTQVTHWQIGWLTSQSCIYVLCRPIDVFIMWIHTNTHLNQTSMSCFRV